MKSFKNFLGEVKKPTGKLKDACWTGYTAVGMKMKGGRKVPNCVPEEVEMHEAKDEEYSDPHMAVNQLKTIMHNAQELMDMIGDKTDLPEWVESKITLAEDYIMTVANYMRSEMHEEVEHLDELNTGTLKRYAKKASQQSMKAAKAGDDEKSQKRSVGSLKAVEKIAKKEPLDTAGQSTKNMMKTWHKEEVEQIDEKSAAWQRKEGKSESGGLNRKGVASYRRENPGSKLKMAVTTKPSKLKPGSKAAKRRKSFCARMSGMKKRLTSAKTARDPDSRINKALRKWNC